MLSQLISPLKEGVFLRGLDKIMEGYRGCKRVLRVSHKPNRSEYLSLSKIVGLGIVGIGVFGLLINLLFSYLGFFG